MIIWRREEHEEGHTSSLLGSLLLSGGLFSVGSGEAKD